MKVHAVLHRADPFLKAVVVLGTVIYLVEVSTGAKDTDHSHPFFRWAERLIAAVFTVEYALRWIDDAQDHYGWHYPHSPLGVIDLVSILPFWVGLVAPPDWQHFVRTFRVFRLLKFFRYSRSLQLVALGFYRAWPALKPLCFSMFVMGLFCTVAVYELESPAQPEKFANLFDAAYFTMVTVATVGYGDLSPVTPLGRLVVMFTFVSALAIFAGILGVLGSSFFKVMEEEIDPSVDPIEEFRKERDRKRAQRCRERTATDSKAEERGSAENPSTSSG
jgi:voltage-gated potassium channel